MLNQVPTSQWRRKPVIEAINEINGSISKIQSQWDLYTQAILREIIKDPLTRKKVISFLDTPMSEKLPEAFIDVLSTPNERISRLKARFSQNISYYLSLDAVPDDAISPDISNAPLLCNPWEMLDQINQSYGYGKKAFQVFQEQKKQWKFLKGITQEERTLISLRYHFARDVKILALQAEVLDHQELFQNPLNQEIHLPSGVEITTNLENPEVSKALSNPLLWESRTQFKDRVYTILIGGRNYILKERKTARHTDTKQNGHQDGLTSKEEFQTALSFQTHGVKREKENIMSWEKPLASITFPDGFQFCIFDYEENLINENRILLHLRDAILKNSDAYLEEYQYIVSRLKTTHKNYWKKYFLSMQDFAKIKAIKMIQQSKSLMTRTMYQNGFMNFDHPWYHFRIHQENGKIILETIWFDFEYYKPLTDDTKIDYYQDYLSNDLNFQKESGLDSIPTHFHEYDVTLQKEAYLFLFESD